MSLLSLFNSPEKWVKGIFAKNKSNNSVEIDSEDAFCFCLAGGLARFKGLKSTDSWKTLRGSIAYKKLVAAIKELNFGNRLNVEESLSSFNDHPDTTFEDVRKVIAKAGL